MADFEKDLDYLLNDTSKASNTDSLEVNGGGITFDDKKKFEFDKKDKKILNRLVTVDDIKSDIADLNFSDDEPDKPITKKMTKGNKKTRQPAKIVNDNGNRGETPKKSHSKTTKSASPQTESIETNNEPPPPLSKRQKEKLRKQRKAEREAAKKSASDNEESVTEPQLPKEPQSSKPPKSSKQKQSKPPKKDPQEGTNSSEKPLMSATPSPEPDSSVKSGSPGSVEDPFSIKLKSVKVTHSNKKYSERLPKLSPIETIMGLSHEQIYKLNSNDIKLKRIISQSNKNLLNIINFSINHESDFLNEGFKAQFVLLCTNIAIYESRGLNKTLKTYPDIIETFSVFDELTLNHNNTKFTKSDKEIHQNNFDYSVLSYVGNIIIWLNSINKDLHLVDKQLIKNNFGGYHLWDQLFKENSINMKRWKHIIKFRDDFSFQPNQFIVIMKFLHIEIS